MQKLQIPSNLIIYEISIQNHLNYITTESQMFSYCKMNKNKNY